MTVFSLPPKLFLLLTRYANRNAKKWVIKSEIEEINQVRTEFQMIQDLLIARKNQDNSEMSKYVQKNKLVRYTFTISLKKEPENNAKKLDTLCKKYREKFRITPDWKVV